MNVQKIRGNVLMVTKLYPEVKKSRNLLAYRYWHEVDKADTMEKMVNSTPYESITREFRKLVEIGEIYLDEATRKALNKAEKEYKETYGYQTSLDDFGV